jgi:hypothetical protein
VKAVQKRFHNRWPVVAIALLLLSVTVFAGISNRGVLHGLAIYFGATPSRSSKTDLRYRLRPRYTWYAGDRPELNSRLPGILLVPGCLATQPFHLDWAGLLADAGFNVLLLDSFTPRGIESLTRLDGVCEGNELWGFQRAAYVLVAWQDLRQHPRTDPAALYLLGWSHGGWAVLDAVALAGNGVPPPHLDAFPDNPLQCLRGVFALHPYCGLGSYTRRLPSPHSIPADQG